MVVEEAVSRHIAGSEFVGPILADVLSKRDGSRIKEEKDVHDDHAILPCLLSSGKKGLPTVNDIRHLPAQLFT